jgi:hypothetical protein
VNARPEYCDGHRTALRLKLPRPTLQQRRLVPRDEVHLVHEEEDARLGRVLLERIEAIAVVRRVLGRIMRADLEDVNQHADVLEDGRALRGEVRVHERVLPAAVPEVEDEISEEANVVLLDVDRRAEARSERCGIVRARKWDSFIRSTAQLSRDGRLANEGGTHKMRERMEVFPLPDAPMRRT